MINILAVIGLLTSYILLHELTKGKQKKRRKNERTK